MRRFIIVLAVIAVAASQRASAGVKARNSLGLNNSVGVAGVFAAQFTDEERFGDFYAVLGTTFLVVNGVGLGWQRHFGESWIAPYVSSTGFAVVTLPAMCGTDNCRPKAIPMVSASGGFDLRSRRDGRTNFHLQVGLWSAYNLLALEVFGSPSNIPAIWPVINVGWTTP